MFFIYLRDDIFNFLICWLANHCYCYATTFYSLCERYYPEEIKNYSKSWLDSKRKEKEEE